MRARRTRLNMTATAGMLGILLLAVSLRFVLILRHWPIVNADESIIDLMARHISYRGEHPIFFWGQNYMGSLQAYLGAALIRLFGSSAFSVRLGVLLIFALYLVCLYFLVRLLYTPAYALFIIALVSLGSDRMLGMPLAANGGYAETMLFGALIFLAVSWLGITALCQGVEVSRSRLLVYAGLGVTTGLALWSDQLILPAVFTAGTFLLHRCRSELRGWALGALLLGLLVGAAPLMLANLSATSGQNSLTVLLGTVFGGGSTSVPFWERLAHVVLISLPLATGMPFTDGIHATCRTVEPYTHPTGSLAAFFPFSNPWLCISTRSIWSLGIVLLWGIAVTGALWAMREQRGLLQDAAFGPNADAHAAWQQRTRLYARLMLLASGALWLVLFAVSAAAQYTPRSSCRYLICLLLASPAVLWPIWKALSSIRVYFKPGKRHIRGRAGLSTLASTLALGAITALYLAGTGDIFANLPAAQTGYDRTNMLVQILLDHGATRVYSDYSTCSLLMFQSAERIVCGVLDDQMRPGVNRYAPYLTQVNTAPHPAYLFPADSLPAQALAARLAQDARYRKVQVASYIIYYYDHSYSSG